MPLRTPPASKTKGCPVKGDALYCPEVQVPPCAICFTIFRADKQAPIADMDIERSGSAGRASECTRTPNMDLEGLSNSLQGMPRHGQAQKEPQSVVEAALRYTSFTSFRFVWPPSALPAPAETSPSVRANDL